MRRKIGFIILLGIMLVFSGCRSKKKVTPSDSPMVDQIEVEFKGYPGEEKKLVEEAMTWLGTPYAYGHQEKGHSTDCSGMVLEVYEKVAGIKLPRNSAQQADFCKKLKEKEVKAGDLVFFATGKKKGVVTHVGIMLDKIRFIHASASKGVIISEMTTPYYERNFIMYGRVTRH